ncbi:glycosyltransferase family 2 protein [Candidatus Uhrbacteria bacterium]|nr:glycosyltransferase family 2 protein [Candidatus Uhrbacteria bacterium]
MRVIAVVPAYRESRTVARVVRSLLPVTDSVVVVDDGSGDRTAEEARKAGALVVRHCLNRGQGAALRTGTEFARRLGAEIIVHIDADGQHEPAGLSDITEPIVSGQADAVFGSRFMGLKPEGMPLSRHCLLRMARLFNHVFLGIPLSWTDPQSGLRAMRIAVAERLCFRQDGMAHCSEILQSVIRSGWRVTEVPVLVRYSGETMAKGQKSTDALRIVWQLIMGAFRQ